VSTTPHSALLESLLYTTRQGAGFILRRLGRIPPAAVYLTNPADPLVDFYFPEEERPGADDEELLALVRGAMREVAARPDTCAIAVATEIVRDGQRVMAIQAETRAPGTGAPTREVVVLHYPIRKRWLGLTFGEPEEAEGLVTERFLQGTPQTDGTGGGAGY
jgi:hypothetical protein